jgi:hypothetical protein
MLNRVKRLGGAALLALVVAGGGCGRNPAGVSSGEVAPSLGIGAAVPDSGAATTTTQPDTTQRGGVLIGSGH